jgi:1,4-alpha-glucan branching enzyme
MPHKIPLIADDPWLEPYEKDVRQRMDYFQKKVEDIQNQFGSIKDYASRHHDLGFQYDHKAKGWWYREWAPNALEMTLVGDFDQWGAGIELEKKEQGIWEVFIPDKSGLSHKDRVKVRVGSRKGIQDRIPAYIRKTVQDPHTYDFAGQIWLPEEDFEWTDQNFKPSQIKEPIIYEAHVGMAQEKEGVGTFNEFTEWVLPRIQKTGYNCIQLMAVQEHPYYGSFGYHVSNFFAPSSRFGTPEDLKRLVNTAHKMGIAVIMDAVYSHAVKNTAEGLNEFDGSEDQYFHAGGRGYHRGWDSKLFNYGKEEVLRFLLSNVRYWIEEFHFDGFRFDGVTSMLYEHHGDHFEFDHYDKYFRNMVDWDAIVFLQLANTLTHQLRNGAITIAEDMSGMPGMCRFAEEGGIGFDYRLGMGIPDYWIKVLKHKRDEEWNIHEIWNVLSNRRYKEKTIAYAESHDQALVGDKTLAFWLMDKEMYWHMAEDDNNLVIERGIALLKMIKLITASVGGEGYLNFIGNEFGHPEWVDFPREGNDWSYHYARRQWSLADHPNLKYRNILAFEKDMISLLKENKILSSLAAKQVNMDHENQVMVYERNNLYFLFNFHVDRSIPNYAFPVSDPGDYKAVLISDDKKYSGLDRIDPDVVYPSHTQKDGSHRVKVYATNRTALVFRRFRH